MKILLDLANDVACVALAFVAIANIAEYAGRVMKKRKTAVQKDNATRIIMPVDVIMIGTQYYCYNDDTKAFLCQGSNLEEISKQFCQLHPGVVGDLYSSDAEVFSKLRKDVVL
jgi:hypothetical protein|tara:strand:- start:571 stop:909 length:339 start_codon:yes stop_codon:yes gene_type:complete